MSKTYRVVAWSTGNVGRHAIAGIDARPDLELVGLWVSNPDKVGRDAGELAGLGRTLGVAATNDVDALLALGPDVVVHTAMADHRLMEAIADMQRILRAGVNVVSSGPGLPPVPLRRRRRLDDRPGPGRRRGRRGLPLRQRRRPRVRQRRPPPGASRGQRADRARCGWPRSSTTPPTTSPWSIFDIMGFGRPIDDVPMILQPGVMTMAWGSVVRQLAAGLDVELDSRGGVVRAAAGHRDLRGRFRHHREGHGGGPALRAAGHAGRPGGHRARARHPTPRRPGPRMAAAGRPRLLPGAPSPASPTTPSTCSCSAPTATTTRPGSRPPPCGWSMPSPPWWKEPRVCSPPLTCPRSTGGAWWSEDRTPFPWPTGRRRGNCRVRSMIPDPGARP